MANNALIVAQGHNHPALFSNGLLAGNETWIVGLPELPLKCTCKVRYRQPDVACTVQRVYLDDNGTQVDGQGTLAHSAESNGLRSMLKVTFDNPVSAVTPGQSVVFYNGADCLGGAIIEEPIK